MQHFSLADSLLGEHFPTTSKSPSRYLQDAFWEACDWEAVYASVGPIHLLDLGCGKGNYAHFFRDLLGERLARYIGYDLAPFPNWADIQARQHAVEFLTPADGSLTDCLARSGCNVLVSQSVLEHVSFDASMMHEIAAFARSINRPLLQLHHVPSAHGFFKQYTLHGVRQYGIRALSQLSKLYDGNSQRIVVTMGGHHCIDLHFMSITLPSLLRRPDRRQLDPTAYTAALKQAFLMDAKWHNTGKLSRPACLALAIATGCKMPVPLAQGIV